MSDQKFPNNQHDISTNPNQKVDPDMNQNPDPSIPCLGCESTPTPFRSSDGYALCAVCAGELEQLEQDHENYLRGDDVYNATLATPIHCTFCDDYAIGHVAGASWPWSYCANHVDAARSEARADVANGGAS